MISRRIIVLKNVAKINLILLIIVVKNINLVQRYNWAVC